MVVWAGIHAQGGLMSFRGIVMEIAGHDVAYASHSAAPTSWASTVRTSILSVPQGSVLSIDYDTLKADAGGTDIEVQDVSAELLHRSSDATTTLNGDHTASATTITVASTSGFASSGTFWLGAEAIAYSGTTATTFTGCTRGALGTLATAHDDASIVYSYSPTLLGRKCTLKWFDSAGATTTRYTGYIDAVDFTGSGYRLAILSSRKQFEDAKGLSPQQGKARLTAEVPIINRFEIMFQGDEQGKFLTLPSTSSNWPYWYMRVDDELIRYEAQHVTFPGFETTVLSVTSAYEVVLNNATGFRPGYTVEFMSGGSVAGRGTITDRSGTTIKHNAGYSPTPGDTARVANVALVEGAQRGALWTRERLHVEGAEVTEYRVLSGNHVDIFLWLLLSDQGDKTNTDYDILPVEWGCGIDSSLVDIDAFERICKPRSSARLYVLQDEVDIIEMMGQLSAATNCRIFWGSDGILTCTAVHDIYPLDAAGLALTASNIASIPRVRLDIQNVRNTWEWRSDYDLDGDHRALMRIEVAASKRVYGDRPMPIMQDRGMRSAEANGINFAVAKATLQQRSEPAEILTCDVLFDDAQTYTPGMLVAVTVGGIPNMAGGEGVQGALFELLSFQPQENQAIATHTLVRRPSIARLGHVAPCALVASKSGSDVTLQARSSTLFAPSPLSPFTPPGGAGQAGIDDVHWLLESDAIRFVDASTLGSATPTSASAAITAIDYATRIITVTSVPAWLASGDIVQLDDWATVLIGSNAPYREDVFLALADDSTLSINGSDPYVWGL